MDKKTLKILIASIAGVLVLAAAVILLVWKVWLPAAEKHKKDSSGGSQAGTSDTVSSEPSKDGDAGDADSQTGTGDSKSDTGNTSSAGGNSADKKPVAVDATIRVEDVTTKKGAIIKVPVTIEKNPGIMSGLLQFKYDSNSLEYLGYEEGLFAQYQDHAEGKTVNIIVLSDENVTKDGTILYLKFTVKNTAAASSTIEASSGDVGIGNMDEELLEPKFVNGTVTVK